MTDLFASFKNSLNANAVQCAEHFYTDNVYDRGVNKQASKLSFLVGFNYGYEG